MLPLTNHVAQHVLQTHPGLAAQFCCSNAMVLGRSSFEPPLGLLGLKATPSELRVTIAPKHKNEHPLGQSDFAYLLTRGYSGSFLQLVLMLFLI